MYTKDLACMQACLYDIVCVRLLPRPGQHTSNLPTDTFIRHVILFPTLVNLDMQQYRFCLSRFMAINHDMQQYWFCLSRFMAINHDMHIDFAFQGLWLSIMTCGDIDFCQAYNTVNRFIRQFRYISLSNLQDSSDAPLSLSLSLSLFLCLSNAT